MDRTAKQLRYAAPVVIILQIFIHYWQYQIAIPIIMYASSYILLKDWKGLGIYAIIVGGFFALMQVIHPLIIFSIVILAIYWRVVTLKKRISSLDQGEIYTEAQRWTAKAQLKMCDVVKKTGNHIDPELEQELKEVAYGKIKQEETN